MNPTASFLIKLSILVTLSLQVCASETFGSSGPLGTIEDELHALRYARRQLQLQRRQTEPATTKVEDASPPASAAKGGADSNNQKNSKEEELAGKVFEKIIQMGGGLELVTSLGSSSNEIVQQSKKVQELVPESSTLTKELMSAVPKKSDALEKSFNAANEAGEVMTKSLKAIDQKPEDANLIKENFKNLEKSSHEMFSAADNVAIAAIPKLSELVESGGQNQAGQQAAGGEKSETASNETKPAENKTGELKSAEPKVPDAKDTEPKGAEPKIEPIVPDVVVPHQ